MQARQLHCRRLTLVVELVAQLLFGVAARAGAGALDVFARPVE